MTTTAAAIPGRRLELAPVKEFQKFCSTTRCGVRVCVYTQSMTTNNPTQLNPTQPERTQPKMSKSIKQQVLDMCEQLNCTLYEYMDSHFVVESKDDTDRRIWNNGSHYLTEYIGRKPSEAYRELLERMADGFKDNGGTCADGDDCERCGGET